MSLNITTSGTLAGLLDSLNSDGQKPNLTGSVGSLASILGMNPISGALGLVGGVTASLSPNLDGFLKTFDFNCLGKQAFSSAMLKEYVTKIQNWASSPIETLNFIAKEAAYWQRAEPKLKSSCSKKNAQQLVAAANQLFTDARNQGFSSRKETWNRNGEIFEGVDVWYQGGSASSPVVNESAFNSVVWGDQELQMALQNVDQLSQTTGIAKETLLDKIQRAINGELQISVQNGQITWNASATNAPQNPILNYALLAGAAFLVYKFFKK